MPAHSCGAEDTDLLTQLCLSVDNRVLVHEDRLVHLGSVGDPPAASFMLMLILSLQIADHCLSSWYSVTHLRHTPELRSAMSMGALISQAASSPHSVLVSAPPLSLRPLAVKGRMCQA